MDRGAFSAVPIFLPIMPGSRVKAALSLAPPAIKRHRREACGPRTLQDFLLHRGADLRANPLNHHSP